MKSTWLWSMPNRLVFPCRRLRPRVFQNHSASGWLIFLLPLEAWEVPVALRLGSCYYARRATSQIYHEPRLVSRQCLRSLTNVWMEVKCLFRQLLEGLDYLHRNEIIHRYGNDSALNIPGLWHARDVKMQNILLTAKGVLKLGKWRALRYI